MAITSGAVGAQAVEDAQLRAARLKASVPGEALHPSDEPVSQSGVFSRKAPVNAQVPLAAAPTPQLVPAAPPAAPVRVYEPPAPPSPPYKSLTATPADSNLLQALLQPTASGAIRSVDREKLSLVRETVLRELAIPLGAQAGLSERSAQIVAILDARQTELDAKYQFNRLVLGNNVLPPVISESKDVVALDATQMTVAGFVYRIDEPARFAMPTPTWRDWLTIGLMADAVQVNKVDPQLLPKNADEQAFWERMVRQGYESGREQAQSVFDFNLALLERTHKGMQRFYDLVQRGMVSAPVIASASDISLRQDANTISVGNTLFRITSSADFTEPAAWAPLN